MEILFLVLKIVIIYFFTFYLTKFSIYIAHTYKIMAVPTGRSSHDTLMPTVGGIGFVTLVILYAIFIKITQNNNFPLLLLSGGIFIAIMGFVDDWKGISPITKLLFQIISGILPAILLFHLSLFQAPILFFFIIFWIVFIENAVNFMDGINGFAGSFALYTALFFIIIMQNQAADITADITLEHISSLLSLLVIGILVFLQFNITPAKTFMGDTGSQFLGYLFGVISLYISIGNKYLISFTTPLIIVMPFIYDVVFTLIRRAIRGENILKAHREHLYQRLVRCGYSHNKVVAINILLFLICGSLAVLSKLKNFHFSQFFLLTASLMVMFLYTTFVMLIERRTKGKNR